MTKQPKQEQAAKDVDLHNKYNKLKKRYKYLRDEYTKVLESWEQSATCIKSLIEERRFLKKKLDCFFKS